MSESALADLRAVEEEICNSASTILDHALAAMDLCRADQLDLNEIQESLSQIVTACSFQDLAGQRLQRVAAQLTGQADTRADAHLLNGPARGAAPDQAAIDRMFEGDA